ncbi:hypothetical protein [Mesorhizobium sp. J428]|uniref:hypothetical protein n=1 Tax=Mesorhizobium sp. J428 TaxID=2898440 RepID=UPI002150AA65|nr:hypothetical protein [Mesorhizobium sp. J428]MCR5860514.1 hypothetical protein [Mesorhizobium sp. J428]
MVKLDEQIAELQRSRQSLQLLAMQCVDGKSIPVRSLPRSMSNSPAVAQLLTFGTSRLGFRAAADVTQILGLAQQARTG